MRKFILFLFALSLPTWSTIIANDYGTSSTTINQNTNEDNVKESVTSMNFVYYGFDGYQNYGLSDYFLNPNSVGFDFNIRYNFKKYGNQSYDIGPNFSFKLWGQGNNKLFLVAAAAPSLRIQSVPEVKVDSKGKVKTKDKTKVFCDLIINPRLTLCASRLSLSIGYFLWGAEFKLSDGYKTDGFNAAIGIAF